RERNLETVLMDEAALVERQDELVNRQRYPDGEDRGDDGSDRVDGAEAQHLGRLAHPQLRCELRLRATKGGGGVLQKARGRGRRISRRSKGRGRLCHRPRRTRTMIGGWRKWGTTHVEPSDATSAV